MKVKVLENTAAWRRMGDWFLVVFVPLYHVVGGFFILQFLLTAEYTWGRTLKMFVLFLSNLILGYEFVYRELETTHPDWTATTLRKCVIKYSVIPFSAGMAAALVLIMIRSSAH
jgi:hypothetical protein